MTTTYWRRKKPQAKFTNSASPISLLVTVSYSTAGARSIEISQSRWLCPDYVSRSTLAQFSVAIPQLVFNPHDQGRQPTDHAASKEGTKTSCAKIA
jgi:hypothetical protein